jgi:hypothetical protein
MMQTIRENYGAKVAAHFAATFCREVLISVLTHAIFQHVKNPNRRRDLLCVARVLAFLVQAAMLSQNLLMASMSAVMAGANSMGYSSQLAKALANLLGSVGLLNIMLALIRGNSWVLFSVLSGIGGKYAGVVAAEIINTLCARSLSRDEGYVLSKWDETIHRNPNTLRDQTYGSIFSKLAAVDNTLAKIVDRYVGLNFLYEKLPCVRRQEPAPAGNDNALSSLPVPPPGMADVDAGIEADAHGIDLPEAARSLHQMEQGVGELGAGLEMSEVRGQAAPRSPRSVSSRGA